MALPEAEGDTARQRPLSKIAKTVDSSKTSGSRHTAEAQTSQATVKAVKFSPESTTPIALAAPVNSNISAGKSKAESLTSNTNGEAKHIKPFEFEMHYDLYSQKFTHILFEILSDQSTYKHIHNWDEKLFEGPLKAILKDLHRAWGENRCTQASLTAYSTVEEAEVTSSVDTSNAITTTGPLDNVTHITKHLFFTKVGFFLCLELTNCSHAPQKPPSNELSSSATLTTAKVQAEDEMKNKPPSTEIANLLSPAQGRIM